MTYNVRQVNADDTGAYAWAKRSPKVIELIADQAPDLFGVQESSAAVIQDDLAAAFDADYDRFQPKNGSPKTIFFRRDRFARLVDPPADGEGIISIENPYAENDACFPNASGRTAAWLKLRDLKSGRGYIIVNAHVAHGGDCWLARNAAAASLHGLLAAQAGDLGIVLFGDLNSDPQRAGADKNDDIVPLLEAPQATYTLARSARHTGTTDDATYTFNSSWKAPSTSYTRLDYIFTRIADATTHHQSVDRRLIGGISPSDHFAVLATIRQAPFTPDPRIDDRGDAPGSSLAFADVTGDRAADKITWDGDGPVRVYPANGLGDFGEPAIGAPADKNLYFADIDGDGCADRISRDPAIDDGALGFARALCDGSFAPAVPTGDAVAGEAPRLLFARIDGDACLDRMVWDPGADGGQTRVALSACDGSFAAEVVSDDDGVSTNTSAAVGLADVTGDGLADKLMWDPAANSGRTRVFTGDGDGTFTFLVEHTGGTSGVATSRFFYADVDADGHADKMFWRDNFREGRPQLYLGQADGFDGDPMMVNAGPSSSPDNRYFLADIDASGSDDLIAWNAGDGGATRAYLALAHAPAPVDPTTGGEASSSGGEDPTTGEAATTGDATTTAAPLTTGDTPTTSAEPPEATGGATSSGTTSDGPAVDGGEAGCGCTHTTPRDGVGAAALLLLALRRRRR